MWFTTPSSLGIWFKKRWRHDTERGCKKFISDINLGTEFLFIELSALYFNFSLIKTYYRRYLFYLFYHSNNKLIKFFWFVCQLRSRKHRSRDDFTFLKKLYPSFGVVLCYILPLDWSKSVLFSKISKTTKP